MFSSIAVLLLAGLMANKLIGRKQVPGLLGMLLVGITLGPYVLDTLSPDLMHISQEIRSFALIIILLRAGLGISRSTLARVGQVALKLSSIPCFFEGLAVMSVTRFVFGWSWADSGMLGFILAAVSPAVVVPAMLELKDQGYGVRNEVPTIVLAGASIDDVLAITLFTAFLGMATSSDFSWVQAVFTIPASILAAVGLGLSIGALLLKVYKSPWLKTRNTEKLVVLLAVALLFFEVGERYGLASLLGIMAISFMILDGRQPTALAFSIKLARVWVFAEILLFTLIGATVNVSVIWNAGLTGLAIVFLGLVARGLGVMVATYGSSLSLQERLFCMIAYTPKATVQAAVGAIPLSMGIAAGDTILAIAVLAIIITAPLGAIGIRYMAPRLLDYSPKETNMNTMG